MNFEHDFGTIDLILNSTYESRGVDAFILSYIKAEKQMRRIFTYLVYQSPSYTFKNYTNLRLTLADNKKMYFNDFINGINLILPTSLKDIYGEDYDTDFNLINSYSKDRNKIFHGQITSEGLSRPDLIERVNCIKKWCKTLGDKLKAEIEYDGFGDSYVKSNSNLNLNLEDVDSIEKYQEFLKELNQLHKNNSRKNSQLKSTIEEGIQSGRAENFNPEEHLLMLKTRKKDVDQSKETPTSYKP